MPLILALHYGGHGAPYYGKDILTGLVEPALREVEAIIVAPDCTGDDWTDAQSEEDVIALLDHVQGAYNIDPQRILVTGYSMGGIGTWHLAARHQDRFTAALVMAGVPPPDRPPGPPLTSMAPRTPTGARARPGRRLPTPSPPPSPRRCAMPARGEAAPGAPHT